jgi:chemotaxis protein methyltransferase CheR
MTNVAASSVEEFEPLLVAIEDTLGIVVPEEQRSMLMQRVISVMKRFSLKTHASLAEKLRLDQRGQVATELLTALSMYTPGWYITPENHQLLHDYVFDQLSDGSRLWLVGCGRGELAYAMAMELDDFEHQHGIKKNIEIIATDTTSAVVEHAGKGVYDVSEVSGLRAEYRNLYLATTSNKDEFEVKARIRDRLQFVACDVVRDCPVRGKFDVIFCPEILAYFSNGMKALVLNNLAAHMQSGAILIPDAHQVLPADAPFERVDIDAGRFYRRK